MAEILYSVFKTCLILILRMKLKQILGPVTYLQLMLAKTFVPNESTWALQQRKWSLQNYKKLKNDC